MEDHLDWWRWMGIDVLHFMSRTRYIRAIAISSHGSYRPKWLPDIPVRGTGGVSSQFGDHDHCPVLTSGSNRIYIYKLGSHDQLSTSYLVLSSIYPASDIRYCLTYDTFRNSQKFPGISCLASILLRYQIFVDTGSSQSYNDGRQALHGKWPQPFK